MTPGSRGAARPTAVRKGCGGDREAIAGSGKRSEVGSQRSEVRGQKKDHPVVIADLENHRKKTKF
jgi:hypothetical protein